ncbi:MAG: PIN domain-containing protein [Chloroflexota bacterium]|nr:PIN domain-containing protein [Chloroflexota bacterium]
MLSSQLPTAYADTSALLAVALEEPTAATIAQRLAQFPRLVASNLLEAEMRAAFGRLGLEFDDGLLSDIEWVFLDRPLTEEIKHALSVAYLRGADLWHIATALYVQDTVAGEMTFITLDNRQRSVAANLGFAT